MEVYGEKRKTVVFNLDSAEERAMYELVCKISFSKWVKRCLAAELRARAAQQNTSNPSIASIQFNASQF